MKIIPPHNKRAIEVDRIDQIEADQKGMIELVNRTDFKGRYKSAFALSHAQVSNTPYSFFVVATGIVEAFGTDTIINADIIEADEPCTSYEACLSWPFRGERKIPRYNHIIIECLVPVEGMKKLFKKLEKKTIELYGLAAWIAQHEIDHAKGITIY